VECRDGGKQNLWPCEDCLKDGKFIQLSFNYNQVGSERPHQGVIQQLRLNHSFTYLVEADIITHVRNLLVSFNMMLRQER
jgi:hypothetical protein